MPNFDLDTPFHPTQDDSLIPHPALLDLRSTPGPSIDAPTPTPPVDLTGTVSRPNIFSLIPSAITNPQGLKGAYEQVMAQRARPIAQRLLLEGTKALYSGDTDTVQRIITGLSNLAGQFPEYGRIADSFIKTVNDRQVKLEGNTALLDVAEQYAKASKDSQAMKLVGVLTANATKLNPEHMQKIIENLHPDIKVNENWTQVTSRLSGEPLSITPTKTMLKLSDLTPTQNEALESTGIDKQQYIDLQNSAISGQKLTAQQWTQLQNANQMLYGDNGAIPQAIGRKNVPPMQAIEHGFNPNDIPGVIGLSQVQRRVAQNITTSEQVDTLRNTNVIASQLQMPPKLTQLWTGILQQESSMGHPDKLVGDGGTAFGPGQVRQDALDLVNKNYNTNFTLDDIKRDRNLGQLISGQYLMLLNKQYNGDLQKVAEAYNGSGPNARKYATEVMNKAGLQPRTQTPVAEVSQQSFPPYDPSREAPAQYYQRLQQFKQAQQQFSGTAGAQQALAQNQPMRDNDYYWRMVDGKLEQYQGPRLSATDMMQQGYFGTDRPQDETKRFIAFAGLQQQGEDLFNTIKYTPSDKLGNIKLAVSKAIANGIYVPVQVPGIGVKIPIELPGLGLAVLDRDDAILYNKLISFAQNSEKFTNVLGKDNAYIKSQKAALTGMLADKDSMLGGIKAMLDTASGEVEGVLKTKNAVIGMPSSERLVLPPKSQQGGVMGKIESALHNALVKLNAGATGGYDADINQALNEGVITPLMDAMKMTGKTVSGLAQQFSEKLRNSRIAQPELAAPEDLLRGFGAFLKSLVDPNYKPDKKTEYRTLEQAITPTWAKKKKKPVPDEVLQGIKKRLQ